MSQTNNIPRTFIYVKELFITLPGVTRRFFFTNPGRHEGPLFQPSNLRNASSYHLFVNNVAFNTRKVNCSIVFLFII